MKISEIKNALNSIEENKNLRSVKDFRMISATKAVDENQKEYTVFSSNNYLGLTHEKSVIEAGKAALVFGTGSSRPVRATTVSNPSCRSSASTKSEIPPSSSTISIFRIIASCKKIAQIRNWLP